VKLKDVVVVFQGNYYYFFILIYFILLLFVNQKLFLKFLKKNKIKIKFELKLLINISKNNSLFKFFYKKFEFQSFQIKISKL